MKVYILLLCALVAAPLAIADENYMEREDVRAYVDDIVNKYAFDRKRIEHLIGGVSKQKNAIKALDTPAEAKPWYEYRDIFLTKSRINKGIIYWHNHDALIKKVSEHYQVPPEIIVALIGVETFYGGITGNFPVLDTLVTLGFDYPRRSKFFRDELTQFLLLCREESLECQKVKGSHGGAMGVGQFISSSYRSYAVDFDKDGIRDLWNSPADIIGSIANYIARHGWAKNAPIAEKIDLKGKQLDKVLNKKLKPWLSLTDLNHYNITSGHFKPKEDVFSLMGMKTKNGRTDIWAGYHNFYVISRYNHSRLYAMAVYHLSQEIRRNRN